MKLSAMASQDKCENIYLYQNFEMKTHISHVNLAQSAYQSNPSAPKDTSWHICITLDHYVFAWCLFDMTLTHAETHVRGSNRIYEY